MVKRFKLILTEQKDKRWFCRAVDELNCDILDIDGNGIESLQQNPEEATLICIKQIEEL